MRACALHIYIVVSRHNHTQNLLNVDDLTTQDLCALAKSLDIDYCISFFKQQRVVGEEMSLYTKEEFVSTLKTCTSEISAVHFPAIADALVSRRRDQCQSLVSVETLTAAPSLQISKESG